MQMLLNSCKYYVNSCKCYVNSYWWAAIRVLLLEFSRILFLNIFNLQVVQLDMEGHWYTYVCVYAAAAAKVASIVSDPIYIYIYTLNIYLKVVLHIHIYIHLCLFTYCDCGANIHWLVKAN